jgi:hypothetical protein
LDHEEQALRSARQADPTASAHSGIGVPPPERAFEDDRTDTPDNMIEIISKHDIHQVEAAPRHRCFP